MTLENDDAKDKVQLLPSHSTPSVAYPFIRVEEGTGRCNRNLPHKLKQAGKLRFVSRAGIIIADGANFSFN